MWAQTKSSWLGCVAWAVIVAATVEVALSSECTPSSCPDQPVFVGFTSLYCMGDRVFSSLNLPWGECENHYSSSQLTSFTDHYYEIADYNGLNCGKGVKFPRIGAERFYFGGCINWGDWIGKFASSAKNIILPPDIKRMGMFNPLSFMILRNANQSFTSPQYPVIIPGVPYSYGTDRSCSSIKDCEAKGQLFTQNLRSNCSFSEGFSVSNVSANACYRSKHGYESYRCVNEHTMESLMSPNADCSFPLMSIVSGGTCDNLSQQTIYCAAKPQDSNSKLQKTRQKFKPEVLAY